MHVNKKARSNKHKALVVKLIVKFVVKPVVKLTSFYELYEVSLTSNCKFLLMIYFIVGYLSFTSIQKLASNFSNNLSTSLLFFWVSKLTMKITIAEIIKPGTKLYKPKY